MKRVFVPFIAFFILLISTAWSQEQVCGCTDPLAHNYDTNATVNDGSCKYALSRIKAKSLGRLDSLVTGSSSLFYWNNSYWTYNDHNDNCIYGIDSTNGSTLETVCFKKIKNQDTEEISQDSLYLYFGDIGNNSGNRRNLQILRVDKKSIVNQQFIIDTIRFSYEDQTDFTKHPQATDFDCEAFIVTDDSIYLFTKQWATAQTTVYSLPNTPGTHIAQRRDSYNVKGLITGATYLPDHQLIVLCGYNYDKSNILSALQPFLVLLYDYKDNFFFSGNKRRLEFATPNRAQMECIATSNALDYYVTCEHFQKSVMGFRIDIPAQLMRVDLRDYILPYLEDR
ncbi:MAG: hypothetical protein K6A41_08935 [Bacteroidales bacterium]|nr:hypothetical protein [Bacteroidales bacterium]